MKRMKKIKDRTSRREKILKYKLLQIKLRNIAFESVISCCNITELKNLSGVGVGAQDFDMAKVGA